MGFSASIFGGGGLAGAAASSDPVYTNVDFADTVKVDNDYTLTHTASSVSGFKHNLSMASSTSNNHSYLNWANSGAVYFDSGVALSTLAGEKGFEASLLIEFNESAMNNAFAGFSDTGVDFSIGLFISNGKPGSGGGAGVGDVGFYNGVLFNLGSANRLFESVSGRISVDASISSAGAQVSSDFANDHLSSLRMHITGGPSGTASSPTAHFAEMTFIRQLLDHSDSDHLETKTGGGNNRDVDIDGTVSGSSATGNLTFGIMVAQKYRSGTPSVKAIDFNMHVQLLRFGQS
tara:strand:- start:680 stop:1549 length:870 start_codon:yes stop_codon:yes gene_type:complete